MKVSPRYDGQPILEIDGPANDQAVIIARQRRRMESLLSGLSDDEWSTPSRCDAWSIQDVIAHLVGVNAFWEASVRAGLTGTPTRILAAFDPVVHPAMMVDALRAQTASETFDQFVASNDGLLDALAPLDDTGWSTRAETPAGHVPIRLLAYHALWDAWIHERDIALPLGIATAEEPDEMESALRYAAAIGSALAMGSGTAFSGVLGVVASEPDVYFTVVIDDSVHVRHEAPSADMPCVRGPAVELIEALSIRAPLPEGTCAEWHEVMHSLATVFDTAMT
jgi:uncharacterized protein (TIGR03083 family)